jgi:hypothetical protein
LSIPSTPKKAKRETLKTLVSNGYRPFEATNYFKATCPKHPDGSDKIELAAKLESGRLFHQSMLPTDFQIHA